MDQKIEIFCCYAHEDQQYLKELKESLIPLQRQGTISLWNDTDISPGTPWEEDIHNHLNTAQIILLLVSPSFMASDYCYGVEMKRAMKRHEQKKARVIPVIIRPIIWEDSPFGKLQALPTDAQPVTNQKVWHTRDDAYLDITIGIKKTIKEWTELVKEQMRMRQEHARMISLLGYETDGGTKSPLWTDPITPELDDKKFQEWRDTKRAFTEDEIKDHIWIKIGSSGNIFIVRFKPRHGWFTNPGSENDRCPILQDGGKISLFCAQFIVVLGLFQ